MFDSFAGIDEVGRGSIAGPVVAGCVRLPKRWKHKKYLNDSKKLSEKERVRLFELIIQDCEFGIGIMSNQHVDTLGIRLSTHLAMLRAFNKLKDLDHLLIDGRDNFQFPIPAKYIIKGDQKEPCIMAASILAKVYRDSLMKRYSKIHPEYGFDRHKGYGTKLHMENILQSSFCEIHRRSFNIITDNGKNSFCNL